MIVNGINFKKIEITNRLDKLEIDKFINKNGRVIKTEAGKKKRNGCYTLKVYKRYLEWIRCVEEDHYGDKVYTYYTSWGANK